jgi:sigma-B regulation protein RsbU (phosphoserine phosphatase)
MRVLPRIIGHHVWPILRKLRKWRRHVTVARALFAAEVLAFGGALLLVLTGSRAALLDELGPRADLGVAAAALGLFGALHALVRRRVQPVLERYFSPAPYDERRILFDLGLEARGATNIDHLYESIVDKIGHALEAEKVSIFVRDDATGEYVCRICAPGRDGSAPTKRPPALARDAFVVKRLRHLRMPLDVSPEDFDAWARAFADAPRAVREARERERETLRCVESALLVQILLKEQLVGVLSLGPRRTRHPFSTADREMLMSVAGQLAFVIENSKLVERMVAEEQLRREIALAAEVQQRLFPSEPPASEVAELAGFCQPARGVGGDYYDFLDFGDEQIGLAVADVAGKGISAALLMSIVQASLRSQAPEGEPGQTPQGSPADLVETINQLLCRSTGAAHYVTFFYAQFDGLTRRLTYVNAGHNPPLLVRAHARGAVAAADGRAAGLRLAAGELAADAVAGAVAEAVPEPGLGSDAGRCAKLETGGTVIGLFRHTRYEEETLQLHPGDLLVAYTDGVTEAVNAAGEEFGEERLEATLVANAHLPAQELRAEIVRAVREWCAGAPQHDDLTFVVLRVV